MPARPILFRDANGVIAAHADVSRVQDFHQQLPGYAVTSIHSLDALATELGVKAVFLKDESNRLGLPAFKILGASWGCVQAIRQKLKLSQSSTLREVRTAAQDKKIELYTASAGNHGRALAAMARILGVPAHIFVPNSTGEEALQRIRSEGANVIQSQSNYDGAVMEAWEASRKVANGLFVQDASFAGYHDIPEWIVQGYSTLLVEVEQQLFAKGLEADLMITPVGVGSLAHAVVRHCKGGDRKCAVMTVEPDSAGCLYKSLQLGSLSSVPTGTTILEGLNCGTVSTDVFPDLSAGVDACVTVSDSAAHEAVQYLTSIGIKSGPCGGATVAALRRIKESETRPSWLTKDTVVVLLCTEGPRNYVVPPNASTRGQDA